MALLVEYLDFVKSVQSAPVCRAIDVIAGNGFPGALGHYTGLALSSAEFELCGRVIYFYPGAGSDRTLTVPASHSGDSSAVADRQHIWLC